MSYPNGVTVLVLKFPSIDVGKTRKVFPAREAHPGLGVQGFYWVQSCRHLAPLRLNLETQSPGL